MTSSFWSFFIPCLVRAGLSFMRSVAAWFSVFRFRKVKFSLDTRDSVSVSEETSSVLSVILSILLREGDWEGGGLGGRGPNLNGELGGDSFCNREIKNVQQRGSYLDLDLLSEEVDQTGPPLLAGFVLGNLYAMFELFPWSFLCKLSSGLGVAGAKHCSVQPHSGCSSCVRGEEGDESPEARGRDDLRSPAQQGAHQARREVPGRVDSHPAVSAETDADSQHGGGVVERPAGQTDLVPLVQDGGHGEQEDQGACRVVSHY